MRRLGEVAGAVALLALAAWCWNSGVTTGVFAATPDGPPEFVSTRYSGSWIAAAAVCVTVAGLLAVDVLRVTVRSREHTG